MPSVVDIYAVRIPTHSKSGKYGSTWAVKSTISSPGSYLENINLEEMMNGDEELFESKRLCSSCDPKTLAMKRIGNVNWNTLSAT